MIRNIILLLIILLGMGIILYIIRENKNSQINWSDKLLNKKIIVVYYSNSGSTEKTSKIIQKNLGCDIKKITLKAPYNDKNMFKLIKTVIIQKKNGYIPETEDIDISDYDIIFVGSPVWAFHLSLPIKDFLLKNNFENKTIVPFYSVGAFVKKENLDKEISKYAKNAKILKSYITYLNGMTLRTSQVKQWLNKLDF